MENLPRAQKQNVRFYISVTCLTWFLLTSWFWPYMANIIYSLPVGLFGIFLSRKIRDKKRQRIARIMFMSGLTLALIIFIILKS